MSELYISDVLHQCGIPVNEARILITQISGLSHSQLITTPYNRLPEKIQVAFKLSIARRQQGEPIAYIIGKREFFGREFKVNSSVLIPRPETEHLIEATLARLPKSPARVWDLGTGSGIIAITLKCERPDLTIFASDISQDALQIAKENAQKHHANIHFLQGNWWDITIAEVQPKQHSFDVIVCNPPYIHRTDPHLQQGDLIFEPQHALTDNHDGLSALRTLIQGSKGYLKKGGYFCCEHGYDQAQSVRDLLKKNSFSDIKTIQDYANLDRVSCAKLL